MPYADKEKQREYQNQWMKERRLEYVQKAGGKCTKCESVYDLEFHHIDHTTKVSHRIWSWKRQRIEEELKKCSLLCRKCHDIEGVKQFGYRNYVHGTNTCYTEMPCHCQLCRDAVAADRRRQRANKSGCKSVNSSRPVLETGA